MMKYTRIVLSCQQQRPGLLKPEAPASLHIFTVFITNTCHKFLCRQTKYLIKQKSAAGE